MTDRKSPRVPSRPGDLPSAKDLGLPEGSFVAVAAPAIRAYRLVRTDPPTERDFQPMSPAARARHVNSPEILKSGISHFLVASDARNVARRPDPLLAEVLLDGPGIHVARSRLASHVTVWAEPSVLVARAKVVRNA